jgi:non-heme chloroperoxidase
MSIDRPRARWTLALAFILAACVLDNPARSQERTGIWQGAFNARNQAILLEMRISTGSDGKLTATLYEADRWPQGLPVGELTLEGPQLKFAASSAGINYGYDGKFTAADTLEGTLVSANRSFPLTFRRVTEKTAKALDPSPHTTQFIEVQPGVKLEVLDWGGTGRPLIFLAGLSGTAHRFDELAPKFAAKYHVYGITRRGIGNSSAPPAVEWNANGNYSADRLGDDILAVMKALKIERPVLVGHSIAGQELSSIGSRYPEKVAGLVYLDAVAGYSYSTDTDPFPPPPANGTYQPIEPAQAIKEGAQRYNEIPCPILAFIAVPHLFEGPENEERRERDRIRMTQTADKFAAGVPTARVVRLKDADHSVWLTHEEEVIREMNAFVRSLK